MLERNRLRIFIIIVLCIGSVLITRLFSMSVLRHDEFVALAEDQQNVERDILPRRGGVYLQDYAANRTIPVAQSVERFAFSATPRNLTHKAEYARMLAPLLGVEEDKLRASFERDSLYMDPAKHGLLKSEVEELAKAINDLHKSLNPSYKERALNFDAAQGDVLYFINGTFFVREYHRIYPEKGLLGQVLGFVDDKGKGQYGFEGQFDQELRGYQGRIRLERDSSGTLLGESGAIDGQDGTGYELTIDRSVQYFAERALADQMKDSEAKGGTVIVMDPKNGEILAMASSPSYDPNLFREAAKQDIGLFDNPAISKQWEPGSIFKPLIMAAAVDQGVVTPETKETFGASVHVDGYEINTALNKAYGEETMTDVLANSDNVAMVWLANKMGNQMMYDYLKKFGFGATTGVDLRNEIAGTVTPLEKWRTINRATISFGQGIAVTPLQIMKAYSSIANDGLEVQPHVVKAVIRPDGTKELVATPEGDRVLQATTAEQLRQMLVAVIVKSHKRAGVEGYKLGGKTGTAQVPNPEGAGYIEGAFNHSFIGMGPADDPKFLILTKIDQPNLEKVGQFAEGTAVPLFSKMANFLLNYYQIPPTNR